MKEFALKYWLEALFGAILAAGACMYRRLAKKVKKTRLEQDALRDGIQALLRDRIIQEYNKYHTEREIPIYALENVSSMYDSYHKLGGNGTVSGLVKELRELPKP